MSRLIELYEKEGQSPWLDNLRRGWLRSGELEQWVARGIRGITSNPAIFQKAIGDGDEYDEQFREVIGGGATVAHAYWELVTADIFEALRILAPVHGDSGGVDGYVSVEVDPSLANDTDATIDAARWLHTRLAAPNLYVKIPGTAAGIGAIRTMFTEGRSINVTLLFSLHRYESVIDAYLDGLEACDGDLSAVSSVASFFVSRVDTEVDRRLDAIGTPEALALRGKAAVANAQLAYELFREKFSGPRWDALAARGARPQRPLWASTSSKNPAYPDCVYVDPLIGPDTVNTMPDTTIAAFEDHGVVRRTVDTDLAGAHEVLERLAALGVDLDEVTDTLEAEGVASFVKSFDDLLGTLSAKADTF